MNHAPNVRRWSATALLAAVLATSLVLAGCGGDPDTGTAIPTTHQHHHGPDAGDKGDLRVTADDYSFRTDHATVEAGPTKVHLTNRGSEAHQVQIGRTRSAMTPEDLVDIYHRKGDLASVKALDWVGGVSVIDPGESGSATVDLEPGDYLVVCYVPADDGTSHLMKGMVAPLHVSQSLERSAGPAKDATGETVGLREYSIDLPEGFRGQGEVAFRNEGSETHEVVFIRIDDGKTLADVIAYQSSPSGRAPFTFGGGIASIAPGTTATADLDLEPGNYIATCFVPGPGGTPHVEMGMMKPFTVT